MPLVPKPDNEYEPIACVPERVVVNRNGPSTVFSGETAQTNARDEPVLPPVHSRIEIVESILPSFSSR